MSQNYFARHWRGELSLPVSYWINGAILANATIVILFLVAGRMDNNDYSLRIISFVYLGIVLFSVVVWFWSVIGIWRSSSRHVERGGMSFWAYIAKFMVVVGFITMAGKLNANIIPQVKEYTLIAIGSDPIGEIDIKVSADGKSSS